MKIYLAFINNYYLIYYKNDNAPTVLPYIEF